MQEGTGAGKSEITATCSKLRVQIGDEHMMYPYMTLNDEKGYTDQEISFFEQLLQSNAHLIFKYARSGGVNIA